MYIPSHYQITDTKTIQHFIQSHPFATVISKDKQGQMLATHMPVLLHDFGDQLVLSGHFAQSNPQWQTVDNEDEILIIFQGPHGYISSTWYEQEDVPTWDYQSVHVYGNSWLTDAAETKEDIIALLNTFEDEAGARFENLASDTRKQIHVIVGFRISIERTYAAFKLSQNRSTTDIETIIEQLSSHGNQALADAVLHNSLEPEG